MVELRRTSHPRRLDELLGVSCIRSLYHFRKFEMTIPVGLVAISAGVGAAGVALTGVGAAALVPTAMSYASCCRRRCSDLQWTAATLGSASTVAWGGAIGGAVGSVVGAFWK
ncbi:hypothetical protein AeMF1_014259 [Aphanomyces euteiches]|nr:hypothetical protein AeMF1_014259 [Aphanomyces euteiches]KAH9183224.1 hypothetical protein AeNC1_014801 [Aphanomyces euteiches]